MTHQRHEEAKRERRRAERERQSERRLVPLMPILVRLRACADGLDWVRKANRATFREAYAACPSDDDIDWLVWALARVRPEWVDRRRAIRFPLLEQFGVDAANKAVRQSFTAAEVERALYDYAVREGLA